MNAQCRRPGARRAHDQRSQRGQAVVIVGAMIVALTILGTMVFDVGLALSDRRNLQAYADSAALAGSRSYPPGSQSRPLGGDAVPRRVAELRAPHRLLR
jgi:Flp pilus assembly protein TadG